MLFLCYTPLSYLFSRLQPSDYKPPAHFALALPPVASNDPFVCYPILFTHGLRIHVQGRADIGMTSSVQRLFCGGNYPTITSDLPVIRGVIPIDSHVRLLVTYPVSMASQEETLATDAAKDDIGTALVRAVRDAKS